MLSVLGVIVFRFELDPDSFTLFGTSFRDPDVSLAYLLLLGASVVTALEFVLHALTDVWFHLVSTLDNASLPLGSNARAPDEVAQMRKEEFRQELANKLKAGSVALRALKTTYDMALPLALTTWSIRQYCTIGEP